MDTEEKSIDQLMSEILTDKCNVLHYNLFDFDHTIYQVLVIEMPDDFYERCGGRYLTLLGYRRRFQAYPLNKGFKHSSYIREKYDMFTKRDCEILASYLNSLKVFS